MKDVDPPGSVTEMSPLGALEQAVLDDLDTDLGGVGWWHPALDWKDATLIGDYLLGSISGADEALRHASYESDRHGKMLTADTTWLRSFWRSGGTIPVREGRDEERSLDLQISLEAVLYHLCQALDRIAAAILIVAGIKEDPLRAEWKSIEDLQTALVQNGATAKFADTEQGRALQAALLTMAVTFGDHGPKDWLPWLRRARSTQTHRAQKAKMLLTAGSMLRGDLRILHLQYRQPEWHDIEALAQPSSDPATIFILNESSVLLAGLVASTQSLVDALAEEMLTLWTARREAPDLVPVPSTYWRVRESALLFEGYGKPVRTHTTGKVHVHPDLAKRLSASMTLDHRRDRWRG